MSCLHLHGPGNWAEVTEAFLAKLRGGLCVSDGAGTGETARRFEQNISTGQMPRCAKAVRRETRQNVDTSAVIRLIDIAANVEGRILDLSLGGCHIRTERRFPVGIFRRVETGFRIAGLPFWLGGVTQVLYDPFNVGIRFLDMSERKREQLVQLIAEIKEMREWEKAKEAEPIQDATGPAAEG